MRRPSFRRLIRALLLPFLAVSAGVALAGCADASDGGTQPPPPPKPVASVAVEPAAVTLRITQSRQLSATVRDASGHTLSGRSVTWSTSAPATANVSTDGLVTAVAPGEATVTATSEGKSGTAMVTVTLVPVAAVEVTPAHSTQYVGTSITLEAVPRDSANNALTDRPVTWTSDNPTVATVSPDGVVTAVAAGTAGIAASVEGRSGMAVITVIPIPVARVTVSPPTVTLSVGATADLIATPRDSAGNALAGRQVVWATTNAAVATVSSAGVVTAVALGSTEVTATSEGKSGTASVTVAATVVTGIRNIAQFLERCPTSDPAFPQLTQDFELLLDGRPLSGTLACAEPISTLPINQYTDELIAWQTLRTAYYMAQRTQGVLPWTQLDLYAWMKSRVAGINLKTAPGMLYCCDNLNGKLYFSYSRQDAFNRDFKRTWKGIATILDFYAHEIHHLDPSDPGHTTGCPAFPQPTDPLGCDATYDLSNLGSYGVQYWLESSWATGYLNIGIPCAPPATAMDYATWNAMAANGFRSRFVSNAPPSVTARLANGGPCF